MSQNFAVLNKVNLAKTTIGTVSAGSITGNAQSVTVDVTGFNSLKLVVSGTYGSVAGSFNIDDGSGTYRTIQGIQTGSLTTIATATGTLSNTTREYEFNVTGMVNFRYTSTAYTSGTQVLKFIPNVFPSQLAPVVLVGTPNVGVTGNPGVSQSGVWTITSITNPVTISGSVSVSDLIVSAGATQIADNVQGAAGASDRGIKLVVRRVDTPTTLSNSACYSTLTVDPSARLYVNVNAGSTGTITSVASSASSVTILAANNSRASAQVYNESTQILYLALSNVTASATVYTVQMAANTYYEVPQNYTGIIKGIWASANGNARVTEIT